MASPASSSLAARADFVDGLGVRVRLAEKAGDQLELLRLAPEFVAAPAFEFALRERVSRLANFRHAYYTRIRRVDRLDGGSVLGIVSERSGGARLSQVLAVAERHKLDLDINAALCLVRQLLPAVAMLHQNARDVSHGALAPERIVVTPLARIVITDYVLGSAIDQLRLSRERLWRDLRIAVPPGAGSPRLDHRADVMQIGVVALSLVLGRRIRKDELRALPELVASATESTVHGEQTPLSAPLRRWLMRALQAEPRGAFESAAQAQQALEDDVLSGEGGYIAAPIALETFLTRYQECAVLGHDDEDVEPAAALPPAEVRQRAAVSAPGVATPTPPPPVTPDVLQPFADALQSRPARPRPAVDPVATAQHELSREIAAATAASHMFGVTSEPDEAEAPAVAEVRRFERTLWRRAEHAAVVVLLLVVVAQTAYILWKIDAPSMIRGGAGTVSVESRPAGAQVVIDGQVRGVTPLSTRVGAGAHVLELRAGSEARVLPITVKADTTYAQYVELPTAAVGGAIEVREPAGAKVLVDGRLRGTVPVKVADLAPGAHEVLVDGRGGQKRQTVQVQAGLTTAFGAVVLPSGPSPGAVSAGGTGWLTVKAPYEMQLFEGGKPLGSTSSERIALAAGRHQLEIVSETLAFRTTKTVDVTPGAPLEIAVDLPKGTITLVCDPPADVFVDGERVGETPILNHPVAVGPHEVTFKHPELGESHHAVTVTAATPIRLDVTLKPPGPVQ